MMEEIQNLHFALDDGSDPAAEGRCSLAVDAGVVWDGGCQPLEVWLQVGVLGVYNKTFVLTKIVNCQMLRNQKLIIN